MNRKSKLAQISRWVQKGPWEALQLAGIKEAQVSKFLHNFKDELEAQMIVDYIRLITRPSNALLNQWTLHTPEHWDNLIRMKFPFPELSMFRAMKKGMRSLWHQRPRFRIAKLLATKAPKSELL